MGGRTPGARTVQMTPELRSKIIKLYTDDRLTIGAIARRFGISTVRIGRILDEEDIARLKEPRW